MEKRNEQRKEEKTVDYKEKESSEWRENDCDGRERTNGKEGIKEGRKGMMNEYKGRKKRESNGWE